jgi:hypothetical protein
MTSRPSDRPVSALRAHMIEDMTIRGFNENTRSKESGTGLHVTVFVYNQRGKHSTASLIFLLRNLAKKVK